MNRTADRTAFGFIISSFVYDLSLLLYTWSTPEWFNRFPRSSAFRFILAVSVYSLCCLLFFSIQSCRTAAGAAVSSDDVHKKSLGQQDRFGLIFPLSFIPVPVFSVLVLGRVTLQTLQLFLSVCDLTAYTVIFFCLQYARMKRKRQIPQQQLPVWIAYALIQITAAFLVLVSPVPGLLSAAVRMAALFLCLFLSMPRLSVSADTVPDGDDTKPEQLSAVSEIYGLSHRECEILCQICKGRTNEEIAATLYISLSTVKTHLSSIFLKTGTRNRTEAAAVCRKK
jgi:DNA-binding CsgD family transcriptional regulator